MIYQKGKEEKNWKKDLKTIDELDIKKNYVNLLICQKINLKKWLNKFDP
jgi:hypothetical protein